MGELSEYRPPFNTVVAVKQCGSDTEATAFAVNFIRWTGYDSAMAVGSQVFVTVYGSDLSQMPSCWGNIHLLFKLGGWSVKVDGKELGPITLDDLGQL